MKAKGHCAVSLRGKESKSPITQQRRKIALPGTWFVLPSGKILPEI